MGRPTWHYRITGETCLEVDGVHGSRLAGYSLLAVTGLGSAKVTPTPLQIVLWRPTGYAPLVQALEIAEEPWQVFRDIPGCMSDLACR
jgi:hypothetical protein